MTPPLLSAPLEPSLPVTPTNPPKPLPKTLAGTVVPSKGASLAHRGSVLQGPEGPLQQKWNRYLATALGTKDEEGPSTGDLMSDNPFDDRDATTPPQVPLKPFFSGLDTLPQGGGGACLPFLKFWVPPAESPPPPVGVGQEWVGTFWGKHL